MTRGRVPSLHYLATSNGHSYAYSSVSQSVFPGPDPLVLQRPQKYSVFPEAIDRATWPAAGLDSPPPLHAC